MPALPLFLYFYPLISSPSLTHSPCLCVVPEGESVCWMLLFDSCSDGSVPVLSLQTYKPHISSTVCLYSCDIKRHMISLSLSHTHTHVSNISSSFENTHTHTHTHTPHHT